MKEYYCKRGFKLNLVVKEGYGDDPDYSPSRFYLREGEVWGLVDKDTEEVIIKRNGRIVHLYPAQFRDHFMKA
jgi:hypothetical protein